VRRIGAEARLSEFRLSEFGLAEFRLGESRVEWPSQDEWWERLSACVLEFQGSLVSSGNSTVVRNVRGCMSASSRTPKTSRGLFIGVPCRKL